MNVLRCISPVDGSVYAERQKSSDQEIESCLEASRRAFSSWRRTPLEIRQNICLRAVQHLVENVSDIAKELTWQMGRPIQYSGIEITGGLQERARYMIENVQEFLADMEVSSSPDTRRYIRREPLGPVFVLAPWNYPYLTSINVIIPALLAGNTVVLKHAQQTLLVAERYQQAFASAGAPPGVFEILHIDHQQVSSVIQDSRIAHVAFTGSVQGGKAVLGAARNRIIDVGLELGGKDPAYVCIDANLTEVVPQLVDGTFFNSGQSCCGIERIYVHQSQYHDFIDAFVEQTKAYKLGNPTITSTTLGPLIRPSAASFAQTQIDQACSAGAQALVDPGSFDQHHPRSGYMAPQVLIDVDHTMSVMQDESFAPLVGIMAVASDKEALELMNDSRFGLTASIWTDDFDRATFLGDRLYTGTVFMNRCDYLDPALAWTGVKDSGRGTTLSSLGMQLLTRPKSYHLRRL